MSLSNQARTTRNIELHFKENEIAALYRLQKSDEEIAETLHLAVGLVRSTRDGMGLPPLRSCSGRLFTPDVDTDVVHLREDKGLSFRAIGEALGYMAGDIEVRYKILKRLEWKSEGLPYKDVIPCKLCGRPFVSEDRRRIRFCLPCKTDEVPKLDCSPYDPDHAGGAYAANVTVAFEYT
jgi:hypothetical protein